MKRAGSMAEARERSGGGGLEGDGEGDGRKEGNVRGLESFWRFGGVSVGSGVFNFCSKKSSLILVDLDPLT